MPDLPDSEPPAASRRRPRQNRSQHTVAAIFEATGLLAAELGEEALTTRLIAERAGVSIGSLYQYFPTREAIVEALVKQERERVIQQLDELLALTGQPGHPPESILRAFVHAYVSALASPDPGRRALMKMAWRADHVVAMASSAREAAERIALHVQRMKHPDLRQPTPAQAFVLTRALMGTVRAAVLEDSPVLGSSEFEDELFRMCWALLRA